MQRMILPHPIPQIAGLRFAARYETSRHVGGDYYDILRLPEGRCGVFVSDVSGHGAPSAIVMAMVRAVLHALPAPAVDPAETLLAINRHFKFLWESGILVTVFYAVVDPAGKSATVACAGHPPPLLRRNGAVSVVQYEPTIPLLLMDLAHVPVTTIALNAGDELLIYTDGITERAGPADSMYEVDRLQAALLSAPRDSADHTLQHVTADVERFAAGQESADDQTLLLMVVTPEA
jgi:sigma-B regulation protein RsbU (phosphoserine phosphatase)